MPIVLLFSAIGRSHLGNPGLSRLVLMVQATVLGGQFFDLFSLFDDGGVAPKVGVGWSYVADTLVVALVVVVCLTSAPMGQTEGFS